MMKKLWIVLMMFGWLGLHAEAQASDILTQQTPFGRVELISCTTALRVSGPLYLALRATFEDGWRLETPDITVNTSNDTPAALFEPFQQPYPDIPIYPISTTLTHKPTEPIIFQAQGSWRACRGEKCVSTPIQLSRTLRPGLTLLTPECSGISLALSNTPIPMYMGKIRGWAIQDAERAHITLDFEEVPKTLMIYDRDKNPLTLDMHIKDKRATFDLPLTEEEKIQFFARTYHHYYAIDLPLLPAGTAVPPPTIAFIQILQAWLWMVLLSAVPIYWARTTPTTRPKFHAQTKQALWVIGASFIVSICFCLYEHWFALINIMAIPFSKQITLVFMALGLLYIPASPLFIPLYFIVTPKPYLSAFVDSSAAIHFVLLLGFCLLTAAAFVVQLIYEKKIFAELQRRNISLTWWCARLPWIGFMLYIFFYL